MAFPCMVLIECCLSLLSLLICQGQALKRKICFVGLRIDDEMLVLAVVVVKCCQKPICVGIRMFKVVILCVLSIASNHFAIASTLLAALLLVFCISTMLM